MKQNSLRYFILFLVMIFVINEPLIAQKKSKQREIRAKHSIMEIRIETSSGRRTRIYMTINLAYNASVASTLRELVGRNVHPVIINAIAGPMSRVKVVFNTDSLIFKQGRKKWHADVGKDSEDIYNLDADRPFGGILNFGRPQQGVILLPIWFNMSLVDG